jgi:hypothetical protein
MGVKGLLWELENIGTGENCKDKNQTVCLILKSNDEFKNNSSLACTLIFLGGPASQKLQTIVTMFLLVNSSLKLREKVDMLTLTLRNTNDLVK